MGDSPLPPDPEPDDFEERFAQYVSLLNPSDPQDQRVFRHVFRAYPPPEEPPGPPPRLA